jgi:hypothetical protein
MTYTPWLGQIEGNNIDPVALREAACVYQRQQEAAMPQPQGFRWTAGVLASLGQTVVDCCPPSQSNTECLRAMWTKANDPRLAPDQQALRLSMMVKPPDNVLLYAAGRWARSGFPQVDVGHVFAAALMATDVPDAILDAVRPPWPAFVIQIPTGLLHISDGADKLVELRFVVVCLDTCGARWSYVAVSETNARGNALFFWRAQELLADVVAERRGTPIEGDLFAVEHLPIDTRTSMLLGRLIANTCLAMSDAGNVKPPRPAKAPKRRKGKLREPEPVIRTYRLGRPITVDCRAAVAAYSRGERQPPSVQVLVRGHHKHQPYGPGRALRKLVWIQPYWRGPDDAPINVRDHVVAR